MKKETKEPKAPRTCNGIQTSGIVGILLLFVCISIGYACYVVWFGTSDIVNKIMLVPAMAFVLYFLVIKAIK
jgi:hypothetical protein